MVLDTHYSQDRAEDAAGVKSQVSLMMKDSSLIEDGKLAMEVCGVIVISFCGHQEDGR